MPQLDGTVKHIKDGVKSFTVAAAIKNIDGWEATLAKAEAPGMTTIVADLDHLKKELHKPTLDGAAISKPVAKLGRETVTIAGKADSKNAEKVRALGETLCGAAEQQ